MKGILRSIVPLAALALLTAGCASAPIAAPPPLKAPPPPPEEENVSVPPNAGIYKIGDPYQIDGTWYYPHEQPDYDETGIASWYGPTFYGKRTADGEIYDANALTAAHRTLPLPVNVRVTNLDNGRSLVVRVNDRGPYAKGRIIDLSERAATLLGVVAAGTARVRVTYLGRADINGAPPVETPPEIANAVPAAPTEPVASDALAAVIGAAVAPPGRTDTLPEPVPESAPAEVASNEPNGQVTTMPVPALTHLYVQVGAFGNRQNADRLIAKIGGGLRISTIQRGGQTLYRVRTGPLNTTADADAALARISGLGANDAQIVVDQ